MIEKRLEEWYNSLGEADYSRRELLRNGSRLCIGALGGVAIGSYFFDVDDVSRREGCLAQPGEHEYINGGESLGECVRILEPDEYEGGEDE